MVKQKPELHAIADVETPIKVGNPLTAADLAIDRRTWRSSRLTKMARPMCHVRPSETRSQVFSLARPRPISSFG
jgi:hypothetical protein